jgi:hypothetical protein
MINEVKAKVKFALKRCPICTSKLDDNYHGLQKKWKHCHGCGFCTYEIYAQQAGDLN